MKDTREVTKLVVPAVLVLYLYSSSNSSSGGGSGYVGRVG